MKENSTEAQKYSRRTTLLTIAELVLTLVFLLAALLSGASLFLRDMVYRCSGNFYVQVAIYLVIFSGIYYLVFIGLDFYGGFVLEHKFALSNQTLFAWVKKSIKKALLSLAIVLPAAEALYWLLRHFPNHWWLPATAAWLLFVVVLGRIAPTMLIPLFYKCRRLADTELEERLLRLGETCGVRIEQVFEVCLSKDTKKSNAAVAGFGKSRRIMLSDTLLSNFSNDEIEAVFAHELGHIKLLHTWKILGFGVLALSAVLYVTSLLLRGGITMLGFETISDIAAFPLVAMILMAAGFVVMPVQNGYLRHLEKQADMFTITHVENAESFSSAITKLARQNLANPSPGRLEELLLYDHPAVSKRVRYAAAAKNR